MTAGPGRAIPAVLRRGPHRADPHDEGRVSWLELYFDLVFVVAVTELSEELRENLTWAGLGGFALLFLVIYLSWADTTRLINGLPADDLPRRLLLFVQVLAFANAAVFASEALEASRAGFAISLAVARLAMAIEYLRARRLVPSVRRAADVYLASNAVTIAFLLLAATGETTVAIAGSLLAPVASPLLEMARSPIGHPRHPTHLAERYGLFALIVLGDALSETVDALAENPVSIDLEVLAALALLMGGGLWWAYFDAYDDRRPDRIGRGWSLAWLGLHLGLTMAITTFGVAVHVLTDTGRLPSPVPTAPMLLLSGSLGAALALVALIDWAANDTGGRRQAAWRTGSVLALAAITVAAPAVPLGVAMAAATLATGAGAWAGGRGAPPEHGPTGPGPSAL